jgi:hypothetical protein
MAEDEGTGADGGGKTCQPRLGRDPIRDGKDATSRRPGRIRRKVLETVATRAAPVAAADIVAEVYGLQHGEPASMAQVVVVRRALAHLAQRGQVRDTGRSGYAARRLYAPVEPAGSDQAGDEDKDEGYASREDQKRFLEAWNRWNRDSGSAKAEAASLRATLPVLRALQRRLRDVEAGALDQVLVALEDRLDGRGWPSLTIRKGGQGTSVRQRRARKFALDYIEAAESGLIDDPDPRGTVCAEYGLEDRDSIARWKRKGQVNDYDNNEVFSKQKKKEATIEAKSALRQMARLMRSPSGTLP